MLKSMHSDITEPAPQQPCYHDMHIIACWKELNKQYITYQLVECVSYHTPEGLQCVLVPMLVFTYHDPKHTPGALGKDIIRAEDWFGYVTLVVKASMMI